MSVGAVRILRVRTLLLHEQVALHGVVADALVLVRVLLHLPHQRLHLRPRALKTVPRLRAQSQEKKRWIRKPDLMRESQEIFAFYIPESGILKKASMFY